MISKYHQEKSFQDEYCPEEYEAVLVEIRQKSKAEITAELKEKVKEIRNEIEIAKNLMNQVRLHLMQLMIPFLLNQCWTATMV